MNLPTLGTTPHRAWPGSNRPVRELALRHFLNEIRMSKRMSRHIERSGHVGTRIAWVRLSGPVCPIFFIVVYVPHKYRATPQASDTLAELHELIKTVPKNDCLIVCGDFNCQLRRNVPGCTGQWSMTKKMKTKNMINKCWIL